MSLSLAKYLSEAPKKKRLRFEILALEPQKKYDDGRTKQSFKDETDIEKIMARFDRTGTISHLAKYEGVYADFSDFDFHEQTTNLARGTEIFDALPAEIRQEFGQSPQTFFDYVNDPENIDDLRKKLPPLAKPGRQLPRTPAPDANLEAVESAAATPVAKASPIPVETPKPPSDPPPAV